MSAEGSVVGRYTVGRRLGQGYSGTVHEARDGATTVALKLVHSDREQWLIDAERRGAQLQQAFGRAHGMVPDIYEIGEADRYFYIAMEFMTVPTLERLTKPMTPAQAVGFARAICAVLEKLHSFTLPDVSYEAVMHADLKPEHVFVMQDGTVKVFDFGTAKGLEPSRPGTTVVGLTPQYAPPERLTEGKARVGDDLWAVGVMLYEMVAGHRPHSRKEANRWDLERAIASNDAREPLPPGCPPALAAIIDKLLKLQREHRYKSAADIRSDLDAFLADREPGAQKTYNTVETIRTPRPPEPPPPPIPAVRAEPEPGRAATDRTGHGTARNRTSRALEWIRAAGGDRFLERSAGLRDGRGHAQRAAAVERRSTVEGPAGLRPIARVDTRRRRRTPAGRSSAASPADGSGRRSHRRVSRTGAHRLREAVASLPGGPDLGSPAR